MVRVMAHQGDIRRAKRVMARSLLQSRESRESLRDFFYQRLDWTCLPRFQPHYGTLFLVLVHCIVPAISRPTNLFGNSGSLVLTALANLLFYFAVIHYIMEKLNACHCVNMQLKLFSALTFYPSGDLKELTEEGYKLDLTGREPIDRTGSTICPLDIRQINTNLRVWLLIRDYLKVKSTEVTQAIENILVFSLLIVSCCAGSMLFQRWQKKPLEQILFSSLGSVCAFHTIVFGFFALDCVLKCTEANDFFDGHDDEIARNKEGFIRKVSTDLNLRTETNHDMKDQKVEKMMDEMLGRVDNVQQTVSNNEMMQQQRNVLVLMDTVMQKISTKDVPITLLGYKIDSFFQKRIIALGVGYFVTFAISYFRCYGVKLKEIATGRA